MTDNYKEIIQYCNDIKSNKILSGEYTKKAVKRFLDDMKKSKEEGYPYFFDEKAFNDVIEFAQSLIIPDINKPLQLLSFQKFIYANIWAWKYKDNPERRRFRTAYIEIARKNSKTTSFLFPFILYDFLSTNAAESYFVSATRDQSLKSFTELSEIIKQTPELKDAINCYSGAITFNLSRISFFSSETTALDSYKNSFSVVDEFHNYDNDKVITAFRYGSRARLNGTVCIITSAGNDISKPCYAENRKAKSILNGTLTDDSYFSIIFSYDEKDDWKDKKNLIKANPALGSFLKEDVLVSDLNDAISTPSHQPDFKSKTCGIWEGARVSWIPLNKWNKNKTVIEESDLIKNACYGALDLSSINDLTAYSLCWKINGNYYFKHRLYIPDEEIQNKYKKDNINFIEWIQKGLITVIPGSTINYSFIEKDIIEDAKKYSIKEIAFDPWQSKELINSLNDKVPSINYVEFSQNLKNFSVPTKEYEKAILENKIIDNAPFMPWMIGNVEIKPDANGNYKPMKHNKTSTQRIDAVISSIMAYSRCKANETAINNNASFNDVLNSF